MRLTEKAGTTEEVIKWLNEQESVTQEVIKAIKFWMRFDSDVSVDRLKSAIEREAREMDETKGHYGENRGKYKKMLQPGPIMKKPESVLNNVSYLAPPPAQTDEREIEEQFNSSPEEDELFNTGSQERPKENPMMRTIRSIHTSRNNQ